MARQGSDRQVFDYDNSSAILGPDGKPARLRKSERSEDILGAYQSYLAQSFKLAPYNPDILISTRGYDAMEAQLGISCVRAPFDIIRDAVLYKGWEWIPSHTDAVKDGQKAETAKRIADALTYDCNTIVDDADNHQDFRHVIRELVMAVHIGFRVSALNWKLNESGANKGKYGFASIAAKPARQIGFDVDQDTLAPNNITSYTPLTGYRFGIPVEKVLRYTYSPSDNLPHGNGIGRVAYKHGWSYDFMLKFLNIAVESFAVPFIMAKAPSAAMAIVRTALAQIRQGAPAVLPANAEAELVQLGAGALADMVAILEMHRQSCAYSYLHATLTSGEGSHGATSAGSNVHQDTQEYSLAGVRDDICLGPARQLARRWIRYNFGEEWMEYCPTLSLGDWDAGDTAKLTGAFSQLVKMGTMHEDEPQIRERLHLAPATPESRKALDEKRQQAQTKEQQRVAAKVKSAAGANKEKA